MANMATHPTLVDLASRLDPQGHIIPIAEVLAKRDPIIKLLKFKECNKSDGYLHAIRTGLPEATWRKLYQGVQPSKSTTTQVTDTCGNLEAYAEVDKDLADVNGNTAAWRMSEQKPFFAAMANQMAEAIFYGDADVHPERFTGLAARYNTLSAKTPVSHNVISAKDELGLEATTGNVTSIFIVSLDQFFGIYPKASKVGLQHTDKGQQTHKNADGSMYEVYQDHYKWQVGCALEDWRGCVRVCNIPVKDGMIDLTADQLIKLLIKAKNRIPQDLRTNVHIFCAEEVLTALELAAYDKSSSVVKIVEAAGQFRTHFFDMPLEVSDSISLKEALVK